MSYQRHEDYENFGPQKLIDSKLPVCPFCRSETPYWMLDTKQTPTEVRNYYRCACCCGTMSSSNFSEGSDPNYVTFKVKEIGVVCSDASLVGRSLSLSKLRSMAGVHEVQPAPQPVPQYAPYAPQPMAQEPAYQPAYQAPVDYSVGSSKPEKSSLALPIVSLAFGVIAALLALILGTSSIVGYVITGFVNTLLVIPTLVCGIIGLIKSIKTKNIVGIILAAVGLCAGLYVLYEVIYFYYLLFVGASIFSYIF